MSRRYQKGKAAVGAGQWSQLRRAREDRHKKGKSWSARRRQMRHMREHSKVNRRKLGRVDTEVKDGNLQQEVWPKAETQQVVTD